MDHDYPLSTASRGELGERIAEAHRELDSARANLRRAQDAYFNAREDWSRGLRHAEPSTGRMDRWHRRVLELGEYIDGVSREYVSRAKGA